MVCCYVCICWIGYGFLIVNSVALVVNLDMLCLCLGDWFWWLV